MNMPGFENAFGIQNYGSFIAAIVVFQLIPGPGTLAILNATARQGVAAGMAAVLGTLLGDLVYMVAAVAGLAGVMQALPSVFHALQWLGCAYLCWMGWRLLRTPIAAVDDSLPSVLSARTYFRQAFLVSLTNPKVVIFFVAFFPLFMRPESGAATLAALMVHVSLISLLYQGMLVLVGNAIALRLKGLPSARRLATRLAGLALFGFGIKLALNNR
jgi:threonine/homoserine/homoserine lactone efflux protein